MVSSSKWHLGKKIVNILSLVSSSKLHLGLANNIWRQFSCIKLRTVKSPKQNCFEEVENKWEDISFFHSLTNVSSGSAESESTEGAGEGEEGVLRQAEDGHEGQPGQVQREGGQ